MAKTQKVEVLTLTVPVGHDAREWCKRYWDTHEFDYDNSKASGSDAVVWPLEEDLTSKGLKKRLEEANCTNVQIIEVDPNTFFS